MSLSLWYSSRVASYFFMRFPFISCWKSSCCSTAIASSWMVLKFLRSDIMVDYYKPSSRKKTIFKLIESSFKNKNIDHLFWGGLTQNISKFAFFDRSSMWYNRKIYINIAFGLKLGLIFRIVRSMCLIIYDRLGKHLDFYRKYPIHSSYNAPNLIYLLNHVCWYRCFIQQISIISIFNESIFVIYFKANFNLQS